MSCGKLSLDSFSMNKAEKYCAATCRASFDNEVQREKYEARFATYC